jgi:hypothetical protein
LALGVPVGADGTWNGWKPTCGWVPIISLVVSPPAVAGRGQIIKDQGGRMGLGEMERATRLEEMGDYTRPLFDVG